MISVTLNKAQKLLEKFKSTKKNKHTWHQDEDNDVISCTINHNIESFIDDNNIIEDINNSIQYAKNKFNTKWILLEDRAKIKNAIFQKNIECGLHEVLSKIELLKQKKEELKVMSEKYCINAIEQKDIQNVLSNIKKIDENKQKTVTIVLEVIPRKEIEKIINDLSKEINMLEEKKDKLNCNTITISLNEITIKYLGL